MAKDHLIDARFSFTIALGLTYLSAYASYRHHYSRCLESMPRPAIFSEDRILGAAASLIAARGPSAATIAAISSRIGAPNGSIYHRFRSRDELLGRLWLDKASFFQQRWVDALRGPDARKAGLQAALSLPRTVREDFQSARLMLLHRREDFLSEGWPSKMRTEATQLRQQVEEALAEITRRLFKRNTIQLRQITTFAVLDLPYSAVRRWVASGEPPPRIVDDLIATAYSAVIDTAVDS